MVESGGGGVVIGKRTTLLEKMSIVQDRQDPLAGLTLDAILANKRHSSPPPAPTGRTLFDIIRDEDPNSNIFGFLHKDWKSCKLFRYRLRLKRAAAAWTSSVNVTASDIPIPCGSCKVSNPRSQLRRRGSVGFQANPAGELATQAEDSVSTNNNRGPPRPQFTRRCSSTVSSSSPIATESTRHNPTRMAVSNPESDEDTTDDPFEVAREGTRRLAVSLAEERAAESSPAPAPRVSLMDLLEETDRQMGAEAWRYTVADEEVEEEEESGGGLEQHCCVCMVRRKGAAFIPCGHTFCRLCSRELCLQRGNCPLCNASILEILDIF